MASSPVLLSSPIVRQVEMVYAWVGVGRGRAVSLCPVPPLKMMAAIPGLAPVAAAWKAPAVAPFVSLLGVRALPAPSSALEGHLRGELHRDGCDWLSHRGALAPVRSHRVDRDRVAVTALPGACPGSRGCW